MKIVVAIKQVPDRDAPVRIAPNGRALGERELQWAMNEPDAYALEEALQLKEKHGGDVVVLSAGRNALARRYARRWPREPIGPFMWCATTWANAMRWAWRG